MTVPAKTLAIGWAAFLALALSCGGKGGKSTKSGCFDADTGAPNCANPACWPLGVCKEECSGAFDEDGDDLEDCADPDCWVMDSGCKEVCNGGKDEDGDGTSDCADSDCWLKGGTCQEICSGGKDEDGDGTVDCADPNCWIKGGSCVEVCTGGGDEDADGATDCDDTECKPLTVCAPSYLKDAQPIFAKRCLGPACHTDDNAAGDMRILRYDDLLKPALYCTGQKKGWCTAFRMQEGSMPPNCAGCIPQKEIDVIQGWVNGGLQP